MQGFRLYQGPSMIDGKPVVAIATGLVRPSSNSKTGPMVQVFIIPADIHPMQAANTGADHAVCGDCRHRGTVVTDPVTGKRTNVGRSCYVTLIRSPRMVYDAHQRGLYELLTPAQAKLALRRRNVRIGSYGDPGAVPMAVWREALGRASAVTGYTHLWRRFPELAAFCMASCDTPVERDEAKALGFRTFRVRARDEPLVTGEGHCPASAEMNHATTCNSCLLCGGNRRPAKADLSIVAHGAGARNFNPSQARLALA
jgi:hypothetical protein